MTPVLGGGGGTGVAAALRGGEIRFSTAGRQGTTCDHGEIFSSVKYSGAKWLPCDVSVNYPWPVTQTEAYTRAKDEEARQAALPGAAVSK